MSTPLGVDVLFLLFPASAIRHPASSVRHAWFSVISKKSMAVFLALKKFQDLCQNNIVLVATDNTTVVAHVNEEGGMRSGTLCALIWRIMTWYTSNQVTLRARHIPGRLNVVADKLSRLGQIIQTEWSLHPQIFQATGGTDPR